jgi:hypothetical protein
MVIISRLAALKILKLAMVYKVSHKSNSTRMQSLLSKKCARWTEKIMIEMSRSETRKTNPS